MDDIRRTLRQNPPYIHFRVTVTDGTWGETWPETTIWNALDCEATLVTAGLDSLLNPNISQPEKDCITKLINDIETEFGGRSLSKKIQNKHKQ